MAKIINSKAIFSALYANPNIEETYVGGRQMGGHFVTRSTNSMVNG